MSGYYAVEMTPIVAQPRNNKYADAVLAAVGVAGLALVWIGASGLAANYYQPTYLRSTTVDLGVSQGASGLEAGAELSEEGSQNYYGAVVGNGPVGKWRAGLSRDGDGPLTQTVDVAHTEGNTAFKVGLKKAADAAWKWKAGTSTTGIWGGGGGDATGIGGSPTTITADLGTKEGDVKWTGGVKSVDGDLSLRAGVSGGGDKANNWALGVKSRSGGDGNWKVAVNAGN